MSLVEHLRDSGVLCYSDTVGDRWIDCVLNGTERVPICFEKRNSFECYKCCVNNLILSN